MPTILITGANRGLGFAFARHYAALGWEVVAANRTPFAPADFVALGADVRELRYDAARDETAADLAARLAGRPVDVLLLNAGLGPDETRAPEEMDAALWETTLLVNAFAPFHLAALLAPNLRAGTRRTVAAISSPAASATRRVLPRRFAHRASKAALNQLLRTLAVEWRDWSPVVLALDPGEVRTRANPAAFVAPDTAARGLARVIDAAPPADSGTFRDANGAIVPW
jgi:NAD(P)-dependent dehydrogenase (short-subunit alcohol dehydrogenase family)